MLRFLTLARRILYLLSIVIILFGAFTFVFPQPIIIFLNWLNVSKTPPTDVFALDFVRALFGQSFAFWSVRLVSFLIVVLGIVIGLFSIIFAVVAGRYKNNPLENHR